MSFSVDDLVASFSSSHIGQEAIDLAALQAQLAETLFASCSSSLSSSARHIPRGRDATQPCNTPTARTPSSSSFNWESLDSFMAGSRSRSSSVSNSSQPNGNPSSTVYINRDYEDDQDELMVEDMLIPPSSPFNSASFPTSTPASLSTSTPPSFTTSSFVHRPAAPSSSYTSEPQPSIFTSTDPFFLQAQANEPSYFYGNPNTLMNEYGRPSNASPFLQGGSGVAYHTIPSAAAAF